MDITFFFKTGKFKNLFIDMAYSDFQKLTSFKNAPKWLYDENDIDSGFSIFWKGLEISFIDESIHSLSIDPYFKKVTILNKYKVNNKLTIEKLTKYLFIADIQWKFIPREWDHECEIKTEGGVSVIFSFNSNGVRISKFSIS